MIYFLKGIDIIYLYYIELINKLFYNHKRKYYNYLLKLIYQIILLLILLKNRSNRKSKL
nr:MAG TPA: hypothetical protein [Caudoviricetes sp.]